MKVKISKLSDLQKYRDNGTYNDIIELIFGLEFDNDESIENFVMPKSLKIFTSIGEFNQPLDTVVFPETLTKICFLVSSCSFDKSLDNVVFPESLEVLQLAGDFYQSLENVKFPKNLKSLILPIDYNLSIDEVKFPESLKYIKMGINYPINTNFPESLETLEIRQYAKYPLTNLPLTIKKVHFTYSEYIEAPGEWFDKIKLSLTNIQNSKIPYGCELVIEKT